MQAKYSDLELEVVLLEVAVVGPPEAKWGDYWWSGGRRPWGVLKTYLVHELAAPPRLIGPGTDADLAKQAAGRAAPESE
jgi:hypothetical protein